MKKVKIYELISVLALFLQERYGTSAISQELENFFGFGRRITVLPSAGIEASIIDGSKYTIRAIEAASFQLIKENNFDFHSGSFSLSSLKKNSKCIIKSPLSEFELETDDPFAILMAVTTNGGLKLFPFLGEQVELKQKGLRRLHFAPAN